MRRGLRCKVLGNLLAKAALSRALQLGKIGQGGDAGRLARGLVGGAVAQGLAGIGERSNPSCLIKQQGEQHQGLALGSVVAIFQMVLEDDGGAVVDLRGGEGKILFCMAPPFMVGSP